MGSLGQINDALKQSFSKIREDMEILQKGLDELKHENLLLKREMSLVREENQNLRKESTPQNPLEKELKQSIIKNKKSIIKQKINELIEARKFSIPEIKEIIVDKHEYCSKASFYRYIEQMKGKIGEVQIEEKTIVIPQDLQ